MSETPSKGRPISDEVKSRVGQSLLLLLPFPKQQLDRTRRVPGQVIVRMRVNHRIP